MIYKNKKAQTENVAIIVVAFFMLGIVLLPGYFVMSEVNDEIQSRDIYGDTAQNVMGTSTDNYPAVWDAAAGLALIMLFGALIVSSFVVDSNPIFFMFSVVLFILVLVATAILANIWDDIASDASFVALANDFVIVPFVFDHFLAVFSVIGFASLAVLYAKLN